MHLGKEFETNLQQRVEPAGMCARFLPDWTRGADAFAGLAYGVYAFNLSGYTGASEFCVDSPALPSSTAKIWLGFSNWTAGRWDWFACPASGTLALPGGSGWEQYTQAGTGTMLAVIIVTGQAPVLVQRCGVELPPLEQGWPVAGHDPQHTSRTSNLGPQGNNLLWKFHLRNGMSPLASPILAADGTTYLTDTGLGVMALDPDGSLLWNYTLGGWTAPNSGLARGPSGALYVMVPGPTNEVPAYLQALNADGTEKWAYQIPIDASSTEHTPAVGPDETIYIAHYKTLHLVNPDGSVNRIVDLVDYALSPPFVAPDGSVYLYAGSLLDKFDPGGNLVWQTTASKLTTQTGEFAPLAVDASGKLFAWINGQLAALSESGSLLWTSVYMNCTTQPVVAGDGTVYVSGYADDTRAVPVFYAVNPDGTVKWQRTPDADVATPCLGIDGSIYYSDTELHALDASGTQLWSAPLREWGERRIACDAAGRIYAISTYKQEVYDTVCSTLHVYDSAGNELWTYGEGVILRPPVINADGTLFFGTYDGTLYSLSPEGNLRWQYQTKTEFTTSPVLTDDGRVCSSDYLGRLHCVAGDGTPQWVFDPGKYTCSFCSPVAAPDGTVYYSDCGDLMEGSGQFHPNGTLYAINTAGSLLWSHVFSMRDDMSPVLTDDGSVISSDLYGGWHSFSSDGTVQWEQKLMASAISMTPRAADGTIYTYDGQLTALNPDGTVKWERNGSSYSCSGIALGFDGTIYYAEQLTSTNDLCTVHAIHPSGGEIWASPVETRHVTGLAVDGAGCIYVSCYAGTVVELNPDGSLNQVFSVGATNGLTSAVIGPQNRMYVCDYNGYVYAFGD